MTEDPKLAPGTYAVIWSCGMIWMGALSTPWAEEEMRREHCPHCGTDQRRVARAD